jgi:hypothetical protein
LKTRNQDVYHGKGKINKRMKDRRNYVNVGKFRNIRENSSKDREDSGKQEEKK